jgi:MIP family channel proteins
MNKQLFSVLYQSQKQSLSLDSVSEAEVRTLLAQGVAESIGTFALVFAGCGAIMIDALSQRQITHIGVGLAFGLIITAMIYAFGHISGGHFNPAITLAFALVRDFPRRRLLFYWAAQFVGALLAILCLSLLLGNVASLGTTLPSSGNDEWGSFVLETVLTFFLMIVTMATTTDTRIVGPIAAFTIGSTITLEVLFAGPISGASMNPARSLAPALVSGTWTAQWVYLIGPFLGAIAGALVYRYTHEASTPSSTRLQEEKEIMPVSKPEGGPSGNSVFHKLVLKGPEDVERTIVSVPSSGSRKDIDSRRPPTGKAYPSNPNKSSGNAIGYPIDPRTASHYTATKKLIPDPNLRYNERIVHTEGNIRAQNNGTSQNANWGESKAVPLYSQKTATAVTTFTNVAPMRVLFLCAHNAARSQIAEGLLRVHGQGAYQVFSAGIHPTSVHPLAVEVMKEIGIDISTHRAKWIEEIAPEPPMDLVITISDDPTEACPLPPRARWQIHWGFPDPSQVTGNEEVCLASFRCIRDLIADKIDNFPIHNPSLSFEQSYIVYSHQTDIER